MSEAAEAPKRALEGTNDTVDDGKKQKISFNMGVKKAPLKPMGLAKPMNIKIGGGATGTVGAKPAAAVKKSVFANDSESEEEEMPAEARMRMRNVGKDTPTSAGPNSFNKTTRGFSDTSRTWEKKAVELATKEGVELTTKSKEKETKEPQALVDELAQKSRQD